MHDTRSEWKGDEDQEFKYSESLRSIATLATYAAAAKYCAADYWVWHIYF